jgi:hypothetical protein
MKIEHRDVERALLGLAVQQVAPLYRHLAWRVSWWEWRIDGGAPSRLLASIDSLMCRRQVECATMGGKKIDPSGNGR